MLYSTSVYFSPPFSPSTKLLKRLPLCNMKLFATTTFLVLPLTASAHCLVGRQIANWDEGGRRYRAEIIAYAEAGHSNTWAMAEDYCRFWNGRCLNQMKRSLSLRQLIEQANTGAQNAQCWQQSPNNHIVWADMSVGHGPVGESIVKVVHDNAALKFKNKYQGCTTDLQIA